MKGIHSDPNKHRKTYNNNLRKSRKISWLCPISLYHSAVNPKIDSLGLLKKYNIKKGNELFDYLIISGVVFRAPNVIDYITANLEPFKERWAKSQLARMGKEKSPEYEKAHLINFMMYDYDYSAFCDFLIEKNIKKAWVYEILFTAFAKEEPFIIDFITSCQDKNIRERKKVVARLSNDEYIQMLDVLESKNILVQLTDNYESRNFDSLLQEEIDQLRRLHQQSQQEEIELDLELEEKIQEMRAARQRDIRKAIKPVNEDVP